MVNDLDHPVSNFRSYIQAFSSHILDIIRSLDFDKQIDKMDKNNRLLMCAYSVKKSVQSPFRCNDGEKLLNKVADGMFVMDKRWKYPLPNTSTNTNSLHPVRN